MQVWLMINTEATENVEKIPWDFSGIFETAFTVILLFMRIWN